jgi:hypothetical protein
VRHGQRRNPPEGDDDRNQGKPLADEVEPQFAGETLGERLGASQLVKFDGHKITKVLDLFVLILTLCRCFVASADWWRWRGAPE